MKEMEEMELLLLLLKMILTWKKKKVNNQQNKDRFQQTKAQNRASKIIQQNFKQKNIHSMKK